MKIDDIIVCLSNEIEDTIFKQWKHEGFICGLSSEHINFEIDGKEYVLKLYEVKNGEHWSEKGRQVSMAYIEKENLCVWLEHMGISKYIIDTIKSEEHFPSVDEEKLIKCKNCKFNNEVVSAKNHHEKSEE